MSPGWNPGTRLAEARRQRPVFTRFVQPEKPENAEGAWRRYYMHWRDMAGDRIRAEPAYMLHNFGMMIQLVSPSSWFYAGTDLWRTKASVNGGAIANHRLPLTLPR